MLKFNHKCDKGGYISLDDENKLFSLSYDVIKQDVFNYSDLRKYSVTADTSLVENNLHVGASNVLVGGVVGEALGGAAGGVIGAVVGSSTSHVYMIPRLNKLTVTLVLDSHYYSATKVLDIKCYDAAQCIQQCEDLVAGLDKVLNYNLGIDTECPRIQSSSIADEIIKLKKLLDYGTISEDEFQKAKAKLF